MGLYKDFLYYVVGYTKQKLDSFIEKIEELVEKGDLTDQEGKDIIEKLQKQFEENSKKFEEKMVEYISQQLEKLEFASKTDLECINERLQRIEQRIDELLNKKNNQN